MVIVSSTTLEVISLLWISRTSKHSLRTTNSGNWVKLSDPKQALRGRMSRIFEVSRAICPSITRASQSSASFGNPDILILSTNVYL
ncbi:hypothetical protein Tco_1253674 [Tanacetum coccineum]